MSPPSTSRPSDDAVREVEAAEERLRIAALAGDVGALDALLADDLVFTDSAGRLLTKPQDLDLHRSGALKLARLDFAEFGFTALADDVMLVRLRVEAAGRAAGEPFAAALRFTRVWRRETTGWRVISIHATAIA